MDIFYSISRYQFRSLTHYPLIITILLCWLATRIFIVPQLSQTLPKQLNLISEIFLVVNRKMFKKVLKLLNLVLKHIECISIGLHPLFIRSGLNSFNHILNSLLNVIPCRIQIFHMHLQIFIMYLTCFQIYHLLRSKIIQMILPHFLHIFHKLVVKIVQENLLLYIMLFYLFRVFLLELPFQVNNIIHQIHQLMVSLVVSIIGIMRNQLWLFYRCAIHSIDGKALGGCLSGTDSTIKHVLILNMNNIFSFFVTVIFIGAVLLLTSLMIILCNRLVSLLIYQGQSR